MVEKMKKRDIQQRADKGIVTDVFGWLECVILNQEAGVRMLQQQQQKGI